jgi:predicted nucleic acid-binding protein
VPPDWSRAITADLLLTSPIVQLELLHSTRTAAEFAEWDERLSRLRAIELNGPICRAAIAALRELSQRSSGYHRVGLGDALIAASAADRNVGVLHYNHQDFDKLREVLVFENVPLAAPGTFERPARA